MFIFECSEIFIVFSVKLKYEKILIYPRFSFVGKLFPLVVIENEINAIDNNEYFHIITGADQNLSVN